MEKTTEGFSLSANTIREITLLILSQYPIFFEHNNQLSPITHSLEFPWKVYVLLDLTL